MAAACFAVAIRNRHVGVYVIWHEGNPSRVVRVGHGEIRERLHYHQEDPEVLA
jgi:hypothetical protein